MNTFDSTSMPRAACGCLRAPGRGGYIWHCPHCPHCLSGAMIEDVQRLFLIANDALKQQILQTMPGLHFVQDFSQKK